MKRTANRRVCRDFPVGQDLVHPAPVSHGGLHLRELHAGLRRSGWFGKLRGAAWETRGAVVESEGFMRRLAYLLAVCALVLAGCGDGGGAADADPADAIPGDALFYIEAVVDPEGDLESDALDAAGKVLRTDDPEAKLHELFKRAEDDADWDRDVSPWLGERAGLWFSARMDENEEPGVAGAIAATDIEQAEEAIERRREGAKGTERSHAGVSYTVDEDGFARAYVDDYVLFGDEPELRRTIDAAKADDGGLAEVDAYRDAIDGLEDERLGHFYADTRRLMELAAESDPEGGSALRSFITFTQLPPVAGALMADGSRLALDIHAKASEGSARDIWPLAGAGGSQLMEDLPADSWGAQAVGRAGETMRSALDRVGGAFGGAAIGRELGLDLERDVFSWVGDAAVFIRGETPGALDGGLVIGVTDGDAAEAAFGRIIGTLQARQGFKAEPVRIEGAEIAFQVADQATEPIVMARGADKVVVTYGRDAAADALVPGDRLGDSELYERADDLLEDAPSTLLSVPAVVRFADAAGEPEWHDIKPYAEAFDVITAGGETDGDDARVRIAAGLR
jgi:Protein of unknown function (DUF3352)